MNLQASVSIEIFVSCFGALIGHCRLRVFLFSLVSGLLNNTQLLEVLVTCSLTVSRRRDLAVVNISRTTWPNYVRFVKQLNFVDGSVDVLGTTNKFS